MNWRDRVLKAIEPEDNPRGTIYGTIAVGLVIAAEEPSKETYLRVLIAAAVAVVTYWLAHGYAAWVGERLRQGTDPDQGWSIRRLGHALRDEWPIIEGGAIPLAVLLVAWAVGAPLATAITADLWAAAGALAAFELAGGLRQRLRPSHLLANAAFGLLLGAALFGVKVLLH